MKKIKTAYIVMLVITTLFLLIPLLLRIPFVSCVVSWVMDGFKISDYKSSYLEVLGGIAGSWLAITGAIYTERKFDEEHKKENEKSKANEQKEREQIALTMCRELLWNEIRSNHRSVIGTKGEFLKAISEDRDNYYYDGTKKFRLENWQTIREKTIDSNLQCAIKVMGLYKYYEFLSTFGGSAKDAKILSQLDFSQYEDTYRDVVKYLDIEE